MLPQRGWGRPEAGEPPLVQNCAIVTISSTNRFACNGKVYTTFDLERQRLAWEASHNGNIPNKD